MNTNQIKAVLYDLVALAALGAAVIAALKGFGVQIPVSGVISTWTYVAVACAAAKMAK